MVKYYCVKQKNRQCVPGSEQIVKAKNGRLMMKCTCAECGITKNQIRQGKLIVPSQAGGDLFDAVVGNATDLLKF